MLPFFAIVLIVFGTLNYYIGRHGWNSLGQHYPRLNKKVYWLLFWLLALSFPLAEIGEDFLPGVIGRKLTLLGGYWLVAMVYFIMALIVIDLLRLSNRRFNYLPQKLVASARTPVLTALTLLSLVIAVVAYGAWNAKHPVVKTYNLRVNKEVTGLNELHVVMVSDIHIGSIIRSASLSTLVERINGLQPDVIVFAGDIVDGAIEPAEVMNMAKLLGGLKAKHGVFAVPGNHDHFGDQIDSITSELEQAGITVLRDSRERVDDLFYIIGRDNASEHRQITRRKELAQLVAGVDTSLPLILLDHQPVDVDKAQQSKIDLQLSGHTHSGQFFPFNLVTDRIFAEDWGLYNKGEYNLIVSSGYGTWGPPVRIGNKPEIVSIRMSFTRIL